MASIAQKVNIEPTMVIKTVRVNEKGLHILLEDESVQSIPEQQDMTAEFHEIATFPHLMKRQCDTNSDILDTTSSAIYELRLLY